MHMLDLLRVAQVRVQVGIHIYFCGCGTCFLLRKLVKPIATMLQQVTPWLTLFLWTLPVGNILDVPVEPTLVHESMADERAYLASGIAHSRHIHAIRNCCAWCNLFDKSDWLWSSLHLSHPNDKAKSGPSTSWFWTQSPNQLVIQKHGRFHEHKKITREKLWISLFRKFSPNTCGLKIGSQFSMGVRHCFFVSNRSFATVQVFLSLRILSRIKSLQGLNLMHQNVSHLLNHILCVFVFLGGCRW